MNCIIGAIILTATSIIKPQITSNAFTAPPLVKRSRQPPSHHHHRHDDSTRAGLIINNSRQTKTAPHSSRRTTTTTTRLRADSTKSASTIATTTPLLTTITTALTENDFSCIPPLDEDLKCTLLPSPFLFDNHGETTVYLPSLRDIQQQQEQHQEQHQEEEWTLEEVAQFTYHRLEYVYGFPHFNYQTAFFESIITNNNHHSEEEGTIATQSSLPPFDKLKVLHLDPLILQIDDFFSEEECDLYIERSLQSSSSSSSSSSSGGGGGETSDDDENNNNKKKNNNKNNINTQQRTKYPPPPLAIGQSRTIDTTNNNDNDSFSARRTSSTWFHHYCGVPEFMAKANRLLGLDYYFTYNNDGNVDVDGDEDGDGGNDAMEDRSTLLDCWEEPQTVRYQPNQKFTWHYDVLDTRNDSTRDNGGQRIATLLVYLNDLEEGDGGATLFRDLGGDGGAGVGGIPLRVQPKKGSALLFFPSLGGMPSSPIDIRLAHCGEAVSPDSNQDKWIAQLWLCETPYMAEAPEGNCKVEGERALREWIGCTNSSSRNVVGSNVDVADDDADAEGGVDEEVHPA